MPQQGHNPNNHGRALMSAIPRAITPNPHTNLLIVYIYMQIANKMGFQKKIYIYMLLTFRVFLTLLTLLVIEML
jgi:hypothetical protein